MYVKNLKNELIKLYISIILLKAKRLDNTFNFILSPLCFTNVYETFYYFKHKTHYKKRLLLNNHFMSSTSSLIYLPFKKLQLFILSL